MPDSLVTKCALQFVSRSEYHNRARGVQWITQYGQHLMERWPGIAKLVKAYVTNDLGSRIHDFYEIKSIGEHLENIRVVRNSIAARKGRSDGKTECYTPSALENEDSRGKARSAFYAVIDKMGDYNESEPSGLEAICTAQRMKRLLPYRKNVRQCLSI